MSQNTLLLYGIFVIFLIASMLWDFYQHKKDKAVSVKSALWETAFWIGVATVFGLIIGFVRGRDEIILANGSKIWWAIQYFSGYLVEESLSVDNLFVMMAIFSSFHIPDKYRHRVLYFGILGAIVLRLLFISVGTALLSLGEWVLAVFGAIVLFTAVKMFVEEWKKHKADRLLRHSQAHSSQWQQEEEVDYTQGGVAKLVMKIFPVHNKIEGHDFFVKIDGKRFVTALFLALVVIEISDVLFAFDSIPAILSISQDVFIVFSSNIFAILGLRALYFVLEAMGNKFQYISYAVIWILFFIGIKMLISMFGVHLESLVSLAVIIGALAIGIGASVWKNKQLKG